MLFTIKGTTPQDIEVFDQDGNRVQYIEELIIKIDKNIPYVVMEMNFKLPKVMLDLKRVGVPERQIDPYETSFENSPTRL